MKRWSKKTNKRCFTLLEVMIGLAILLLVTAGIGGWKMHRVIERKRFQSDLKRLHSRLLTCHRLALNMQADWEGVLEKRGDRWLFTTRCVDQPAIPGLPPLSLHPFSFFFDGEKKERWVVEFSSTGEIFPPGAILLASPTKKEQWDIPEMFQKEENKKKLGPLHPNLLPSR